MSAALLTMPGTADIIPTHDAAGDPSHAMALYAAVEGQRVVFSWQREHGERSAAPVSVVLRAGATRQEALEALRVLWLTARDAWPVLLSISDAGCEMTFNEERSGR